MIKDVEHISPKLKSGTFPETKQTRQRKVELCESKTSKRVSSKISLSRNLRHRERQRIQGLSTRVLRTVQPRRYARNKVWPSADLRACKGNTAGEYVNRKRRPSLHDC